MQLNNALRIQNKKCCYSICITNYNSKKTLKRCIDSVICQIDSNFEIVISDNCSKDGSGEILEEYAKTGQIKLIVARSSRGQGRQLAFENSVGSYIISGIDTDDFVKPVLKDILQMYHKEHEGFMLSFETFHIIPRILVQEIGGWRDLQYGEDIDFARRVEERGKIHYFDDLSFIIVRGAEKLGFFDRLKKVYSIYKSDYLMGKNIFNDLKHDYSHSVIMKPLLLVIAFLAISITKLKGLKKFEY